MRFLADMGISPRTVNWLKASISGLGNRIAIAVQMDYIGFDI